MKTLDYNPSPLETEFAQILISFKQLISDQLKGRKVVSMNLRSDLDNPTLFIEVEDHDGDRHTIVLKIIQRPDHE
jgi:hypothetical protein